MGLPWTWVPSSPVQYHDFGSSTSELIRALYQTYGCVQSGKWARLVVMLSYKYTQQIGHQWMKKGVKTEWMD